MDDYKELIEELKNTRHLDPLREVCADAIEQLVKERNAAIADLKESADCQICKFYDAEEVICIAKNCRCGEGWEWRGVQE